MTRDFFPADVLEQVKTQIASFLLPGSGEISSITNIDLHPSGKHCLFAGDFYNSLDEDRYSSIAMLDMETRNITRLTSSKHRDCYAFFSPDGNMISYLSDADSPGGLHPYLYDIRKNCGSVRLPYLAGSTEETAWSPTGRLLLCVVVGLNNEKKSKKNDAVQMQQHSAKHCWEPRVEYSRQDERWRRLWIYDCVSEQFWRPDIGDWNIWHASWCGSEYVAVSTSPSFSENSWYSAELRVVNIYSGENKLVYKPKEQIGHVSCSRDGRYISFVEAPASDRDIIFGQLTIIDTETSQTFHIDTHGVDVASISWSDETRFIYAGDRDLELVAGCCDLNNGIARELYASSKLHSGVVCPDISACGGDSLLLMTESFTEPQGITYIKEGRCETLFRVHNKGTERVQKLIGNVSEIRWTAPDGLPLSGWLLEPNGKRPHPTIMAVHGGPVWSNRNCWQSERRLNYLVLLKAGYALFMPNPRGSTGKGADFIKRVRGDMGGLDMFDLLSGIDYLTAEGIADPDRLGVTGVSYGGYMTDWLITQDKRFKAAVSVSGISDWLSFFFSSNVSAFASEYLGTDPKTDLEYSKERSPVYYADRVKTPIMIVTGLKDECVPDHQSLEFYGALSKLDKETALIAYPEEGHGIYGTAAMVDFSARMLHWFNTNILGSGSK